MARPDTNSRQKKGKMEISIDATTPTVEIKVGYSTYLFDRATYDALFHAMLETPASDVIWLSRITADMVRDAEDSGNLVDELDDFVAETVMHFGRDDN